MTIRSASQLAALYLQFSDFVSRFQEGNAYPEWAHLHVLFLMPHWDGQTRSVQMYPFLLKGAGTVSLKQVRLAQFEVAGP